MIDWQAFVSAENFWVAWDKVRSNHGCAGVDGETIEKFEAHAEENLERLRRSIRKGTYRALPLRSLSIPKKTRAVLGEVPKTEWRGLAVPTVRDRIVQQALLNLLHPILEPEFEACSFAYRPGRSYKAAVRQVQQWRERGFEHVLDADVVKYFNNVAHSRLLQEFQERVHDPKAGELVEQWIKSGVYTASGLVLPQKGIPQGSVVSPILANVYLDDFDEAILETGLKLVRFADDFVILAKTKSRIQYAEELVAELLEAMGLELHPEKTRITNFDQGFHFLGHTFVRSLVIEDRATDGKRMKRMGGARGGKKRIEEATAERIVRYEDAPARMTQMQQALLEAVQGTEKPIPPPLFVVLGCKVRDKKRVQIESQELEWQAGMSTLYLTQQGATLKKEQGRFVVRSPQDNTQKSGVEIPITEVERVLVLGNIQISTAAMASCLEKQIPVVFLTQLGDYKGHLWSAEQGDLRAEMAQFRRFEDGAFQQMMAQRLVLGKIWNSRQLLLKLRRQREIPEVDAAILGLERDWKAVKEMPLVDLNGVRGYEGSAAARYFPAMGRLITNSGFSLTERSRRPPKDPVNSLLSFGYTLLFNNVMSLILAEGLNPYLGNLHRSDRKEPFLAFDLMEEWRSVVVDSLVLKMVNQKIVRPTDFTFPNEMGGVYLEGAARRVFLKHFEERLSSKVSHPDVSDQVSYRRAIQLQIKRYKRCLMDTMPYEAFRRVT